MSVVDLSRSTLKKGEKMGQIKKWYDRELVEVELDVWEYTTKKQEVVEVEVAWDLEDEDEGRVALSFGVEIGENWWMSSSKFRREFTNINFESAYDVKMLEDAKAELVARLKNAKNDVSIWCDLADLRREAGRLS